MAEAVTVEYIEVAQMVCNPFFHSHFNVNLAQISITDKVTLFRLMIYELSHTVVRSNNHLSIEFYRTVERLRVMLAVFVHRFEWLHEK